MGKNAFDVSRSNLYNFDPDDLVVIGLDTDDFAVDVQVTSVPFFTIDASPPLRSISPGDVTSYVVTVTSVNSYTGNVDVSVVHAISTTHASLTWDSTALVIPDGGSDSATLTVDTTGSIPIQDYTLDFWADDGGTNITDQSILNLTAVISGSISGTVTDQDGEPIDDADVELVEGSNVIDTTITNNDGEYDFDNVDGGTYTVRATKDGYEDDDRQVTITAGDPDKTNIDLQLDLTTYEIEGDLVDKDSEDPIAGATVEVLDENGDLVDSDTTSGNGHFSIDDLPPGTYTVRITADGYKTTTQEVEITDEDVDLEDVEISPEAEPLDIGAYWWLILLIIIIVVVIILVALLAKRKKPEPETVPPGAYAEAQVPQPPSEAPPPAPPEGWPQPPERTPEPPPPGTPPEGPPPGQ